MIFTLATAFAGGATTIFAVPLFPSLVAVIVAVPLEIALTTPLVETVATVAWLLDQVTVRPVRTPPLASRTVAESVTLLPAVRFVLSGFTATDATGVAAALTITCAAPDLPSDVAVIVVVPAPTAVTRPSVLTFAMLLLADDHVIARPLSTFPFASVAVAENEAVWPTVSVAEPGATATAATGMTVTVIVAEAVFPSQVAVMVTVPAVTAVTLPDGSTVATWGALLAHVVERPLS